MMTPMRYHPVPGAVASKTGFGFEAIMAEPRHGRFRHWYDRLSFFAAPRRADVEAALSRPELREAA